MKKNIKKEQSFKEICLKLKILKTLDKVRGLCQEVLPLLRKLNTNCVRILGFQENNNLSDDIVRKIHLTVLETKDILFAELANLI